MAIRVWGYIYKCFPFLSILDQISPMDVFGRELIKATLSQIS
jgi:hypothetical protein